LDLKRKQLTQVETVPRTFRHRLAIRRFVHNMPVVEIKVDQWKTLAVVDTGNAKIPAIIYSRRIATALLRRHRPTGKARHSGATGKKELKAIKVSCPISFSSIRLPRADVVCQGSGSVLGSGVQGNIGLPLFLGHRVIFDYQRRLIHLEP
jgi:hypothetical protein